MKNKILNKVIQLLFVTFISGSLSAQIVYTDINPDDDLISSTDPDGEEKGIDLNNDGKFEFFNTGAQPNSFMCQNKSCFWARGNMTVGGWDITALLAEHTEIGAKGNFLPNPFDMYVTDRNNPDYFPKGEEKYIGVCFLINDKTHYGWVRISREEDNYLYKDYAYEQTPGKSIKAGDRGIATAINKVKQEQMIQVYPNPAAKKVWIQSTGSAEISHVSIYDMRGVLLKELEMKQSKMGIDISQYKGSMLLLKAVDTTGAAYRTKILRK